MRLPAKYIYFLVIESTACSAVTGGWRMISQQLKLIHISFRYLRIFAHCIATISLILLVCTLMLFHSDQCQQIYLNS
jgi:hypothetical protein